MVLSAMTSFALAHPPVPGTAGSGLASDAHERLADEVIAGPMGCWETDADVSWEHHSGAFDTHGRASTTWRFDHRVWRLDRFELRTADRDSLGIRVAPLLFGSRVDVDLRYPTTRNRTMEWPAPVATLPARLFGEIDTVAIDELADGSRRVVQSFAWDGWKDVSGEQAVTFGPRSTPLTVHLDTTDRWPNGCSVRSIGSATLGPNGLPEEESWTFEGRCLLRDWSAEWRFVYGRWRSCTRVGPGPKPPFG